MLSLERIGEIVRHSTEIDILDFKRELPDTLNREKAAELVRDIIAIANAAYDTGDIKGYLVFGVEDKTRVSQDIRGQILLLRSKDTSQIEKLSAQHKIDAWNQAQFLKILDEYISGTGGDLVGRYVTSQHPDEPTSLVAVLELIAQYGPYTVKQNIQGPDPSGKGTKCLVDKDKAWIRRGEHRHELTFEELFSMRDRARERRREANLVEKAKSQLGPRMQKWRLDLVEIADGETPAEKLIPQPLLTRAQLKCCFHRPPTLADALAQRGDRWYLNHLVISSPPDSGRTTLLHYLLSLRDDARARGRPILISRIPDAPDIDEFVECATKCLKVEFPAGAQRAVVFDSPTDHGKQQQLIRLLGGTFPSLHIWITCNPEREEDLVECIASPFGREPWVLQLPGYLDAHPEFYEELITSTIEAEGAGASLLSKEQVVFQEVVSAYQLSLRGIEATGDFVATQRDQVSAIYGQLTGSEQLIIRMIGRLGPMRVAAVKAIVSALDMPLDAYKRIAGSGLVYVRESGLRAEEMEVLEHLPEQAKFLSALDLGLLADVLWGTDPAIFGFEGLHLSKIVLDLEECTDEPALKQKLALLAHRVKGDAYCANCSACFPSFSGFCPNCGRSVVSQRSAMETSDEGITGKVTVPFPEVELLRRGTFDISRGVSSKLVRRLQRTLPKPQDHV